MMRYLHGFVYLLIVLVLSHSATAAISITGVADKQVYADSVTFTVNYEAGYDYTCDLNGDPIATDVAVEVNEPEYYELYVHRVNQSTSAEESQTVKFIVRNSARGSSETGLPTFTPYPIIDSAAAEFVGGVLEIVCPNEYPIGLEIPVAVRVNNASGDRLGVFGDVTAVGFEDYPVKLLRGVGSVFLPAQAGPNTISYVGQIAALQNTKQITIEASTTWLTVSGNINTNTDWGTNARIHVTGALTVAAGATLTIGQGSVIKVNPNLEIAVNGSIVVNGTNAEPVIFTTDDRNVPWGGFLFEASTSVGNFNGTIMTASGADSNWFSNNPGHGGSHRGEQCLLYLSNGANVTLTDCYLIDHYGQAGHGESSTLTMTRCLVQKFITAGQYNAGSITLNDSALIEFPAYDAAFADNDNDGLYLTGGAHYLTDTLVGWALDDGIDAGSGPGGTVDVNNCWFESFYHEAMAWSGDDNRYVDTIDTVAINAGQGIESGWGFSFVTATRCLSTANIVGARLGDNYVNWAAEGFLTVTDSLMLYNHRDVWGRAWFGDWSERLGQMDIQNNYLSAPNSNYPSNTIWDPNGDPNHLAKLAPFLPTPAGDVGIGLAVLSDSLNMTQLTNKVPVRLSSFSTNSVSVNYTIDTQDGLYDSGTLQFIPGETIKHIEFVKPATAGLQLFRVTLSSPVNAELTGYQQITYSVPYEIVRDLVLDGDQWRYFKGTSEPPATWNDLGFNDAGWLLGATGIGYEASSGYETCLATHLNDMQNSYFSVYARKLFYIEDPSRLTSLTFTMDFDDGYIAYINGVPVDSQNAPSPPVYNQPSAAPDHEACCSCEPPPIDLTAYTGSLVAGYNVLAVQVHNRTIGSSDFIFIPELSCVITPWPGDFQPDGIVDFEDYSILASAWSTQTGQSGYNPVCDISIVPNSAIDMLDVFVFVENWLAGL